MAITAATTLSDFEGFLTPEQSAPIFEDAARVSIVQRLARQVPLGISGKAIQVTTSKPTAAWVSEAARKSVSEGGKSVVMMEPQKIASICVMSQEVFRADPGSYASSLRGYFAEAFAAAFDAAVLHGTNTPFDEYLADTTHVVTFGTADSIYLDVVEALTLLVNDGRKLNGFAFDDTAEPILLGGTDASDRPLRSASPADGVYGTMLGRPVYLADGVAGSDVVGFAGDWTKAAWGVVGGINYSVSTEATVTINGELVSTWENNLVAVRAEAEYGFACPDPDNFCAFEVSGS